MKSLFLFALAFAFLILAAPAVAVDDTDAILDHPPEGVIASFGPVIRGMAWDKDAPDAHVDVRITVSGPDGSVIASYDTTAGLDGAYSRQVMNPGHDFQWRMYEALENEDRAMLAGATVRLEVRNVAPGGAPGEMVMRQIRSENLAARVRPPQDPTQIVKRVWLIVQDPVLHQHGNQRLSQWCAQNSDLAADPLVRARETADAIQKSSGGAMRFEIVNLDQPDYDPEEWPRMRRPMPGSPPPPAAGGAVAMPEAGRDDGCFYNESFVMADKLSGARRPVYASQFQDGECHGDYDWLIRKHQLIERFERGEFDEVWVWSFGYSGLWESCICGGGPAYTSYQVNGHAVGSAATGGTVYNTSRGFLIMGMNYERELGCALESFGHRAEFILSQAFGPVYWPPACEERCRCRPAAIPGQVGGSNPWHDFALMDVAAPDRAGVGMMHYAPQSTCDYQWDEHRDVASSCDDWLLWPNMQGETVFVNDLDYKLAHPGVPSMEAHHRWWFEHLPRGQGQTGGKENNWWKYFADPNLAMGR